MASRQDLLGSMWMRTPYREKVTVLHNKEDMTQGQPDSLTPDDPAAFQGLEMAGADTREQVESTVGESETPVEIEVIHPHDLVEELWPGHGDD